MKTLIRASLPLCVAVTLYLVRPLIAAAQEAVAANTDHNDALRRLALSAAPFPTTFGVLQTVALDEQVDAQPLLVANEAIAGRRGASYPGHHWTTARLSSTDRLRRFPDRQWE